MSEHEMVKVYELAKELGVDSISLLDKLKGLNIHVKNHMSELKSEDAEQARSALRKPTAAAKPAKKAPVARAKKKVMTEPAAPAPVQAEAQTSGEKKSSPIIRRRVKADGALETQAVGTIAPAKDTESHAPSAASSPSDRLTPEIESHSESFEVTETRQAATTAAELTEPQAAQEEFPNPPAEKASTYVPTPRPVAPPRKSILKIVEPTPPSPKPALKPTGVSPVKPVVKGTTTNQDKDGFRIIRMTKENLDQMVEEEAAKKRGSGREHEIRPEDVRFADYRKKEMVFLPKKKKLPIGKEVRKTNVTVAAAHKRVIEMKDAITVQELASQLHIRSGELIKKLMSLGQMATLNQSLDFDTVTLIANEYEFEVKNISFKEDALIGAPEDSAESLKPRPPVVTIMGHVDHGKTTLLDSIREANVAAGEAGGITQHIGAYTVEKNGKLISFIDTPGHEAFTVMRARGANVTDIVILVVAADDGVMPQTREAISHAQAAKVPIIVAVNKIDKPGANPEKIKQGLAELNLLAEDWGGDTMFVPVSALKKQNLDKLLDSILLQAEVLDLKANPDAAARGTVLEARLEKGRGPMASLLVSRGTLRIGDPVVSGTFVGKVKAMMDDKGHGVKEALPGFAVEVLGFENIPTAGEPFYATATENDAHKIAENRIEQARAKTQMIQGKVTLEDLFSKIQAGEMKELNLVIKADVFGSTEAIRDSLLKISTDKVKVKVLLAAPGGITESDVLLASASHALIIGFNVRPETKARQLAEAEHVEIKCYTIIYELIDDVKKAMQGMLEKTKVEKFLGRAEVRQIFSVPKVGVIAGSSVIDGKIMRGANIRLLRDSRVIYEGKMSSLRRFKDDAKEVASGFECGIGIENYNDLKPGDVIEAYQIDLVAPSLEVGTS